jgi:hypothetical protein
MEWGNERIDREKCEECDAAFSYRRHAAAVSERFSLRGFLTYFNGTVSVTQNGSEMAVENGMPIEPGDV